MRGGERKAMAASKVRKATKAKPRLAAAAARSKSKRPAASKRSAKPSRAETNPLLRRWSTPFGVAPFDKIEPRHFEPAFAKAFARHRAEIRSIAANAARPSFSNTIVALERSGADLNRVSSVFWNLEGPCSTDELREIARNISPKLAEHSSAILLDARLFRRIDDLYQRRDRLKLDSEQRRLLERTHLSFVRSGAQLKPKEKKRVAEINARLATLVTEFMQNVLKDEQSWHMVLEGEQDLAGLPETFRASAAREAAARGLGGKHVITLARSSVEPFLTLSARRDLREAAFKAWVMRGANDGPTDNRKRLAEIVALRAEYARLLGYETYAAFSLDDTMAKTPEAVDSLLGAVWQHARRRAGEEREALAEAAAQEGSNAAIAGWDWRYYAEKVRRARFDLDEGALRPYLQLDNVIAAAFAVANRLFGLTFTPRDDVPRYHEDVRVWEVKDRRGQHVGLFLGDYFARASKRSGAWMSSFRPQHRLGRGQHPIIVNVTSFARGADGAASLLSIDDARTLFHEFGHGLHGLLSNVTYPSLAGTAVSRDFVELPSQLYEHWLLQPQVLQEFATHERTSKPIPLALIKRLKKARNFNQGFATVEFTASAIADMRLYTAANADDIDVDRFEREILDDIGMPQEIVMRHRLPHFMHIVSGYAAGYYSYMWSEVMDADAFAAFEEAGDIFDRKTADKLRRYIYGSGNTRDPEAAYIAFRGRPPSVEGLLRNRGFL